MLKQPLRLGNGKATAAKAADLASGQTVRHATAASARVSGLRATAHTACSQVGASAMIGRLVRRASQGCSQQEGLCCSTDLSHESKTFTHLQAHGTSAQQGLLVRVLKYKLQELVLTLQQKICIQTSITCRSCLAGTRVPHTTSPNPAACYLARATSRGHALFP